jgi:hypothetical protein
LEIFISTQAMGRQKRKASPESSQSATPAKIQNTMDFYQTGGASSSSIANLPDPVVNFPDFAQLLGAGTQNSLSTLFNITPRWMQLDFYLGPGTRVIDKNLWIRRYKDPATLSHEIHWMRENNRQDGTQNSLPSRQRVSICQK